ncbi:FG-GAP-like repeat-containing protein [Streptomyces sp. NBC_01643]|uniref:FG-GAP-like repeat-containing protein n=1 Tax=Streptomyces sp. NBC_01643 TaxID=2975906 RepID=UPI003864E3BC|nr:VCBS repeat-containing protein [Streptomyces sp. NBC_01643]
MRKHTIATVVALTAVSFTPLTLPPTPATAAPSKYADDFNGDGYRDLATAAVGATVGGASRAGAVVVNYGSASGISASRRTVLSQNSSGVPGTGEKNDAFGSVLASGDLNNDGYADLVVGTGGEDVGADTNGGTVVVLWGSARGLSGGTTIGDPDPSGHDLFGKSLAVGDFTGDGSADLAVGSMGSAVWIYKGGFTKSSGAASKFKLSTDLEPGTSHGARTLTSGDFNADGYSDLLVTGFYNPNSYSAADGSLVYLGSATGLAYQDVLADGDTVATGDLNADGYDDVIVSWAWGGSQGDAGGSIVTYLGGDEGVRTGTAQVIDQDTPGVPGDDESSDYFGNAISIGDIDGDGHDDAAVSSYYESIGDTTLAGSVTVFRGNLRGLSTNGVKVFHQGTTGVPGANEDDDHFGSAVRLADLNADGHADLSVGADGENSADGAIWNLRGTSSGVTTKGAVSFGASAVGISAAGYPFFGNVMAD